VLVCFIKNEFVNLSRQQAKFFASV